jgi:spore germination protein GerM
VTAPLRRVIAVASVAVLVALGACGDDDDGGAATTTTAASATSSTGAPGSSTTAPEAEPHLVSVYLLRGEELAVGEARTAETDAVLAEALRALLDGPTDFEREIGLTSAIPEGTRLLGVELVDGVARVDLSAEIGSGGGSLSMQARVAQLVHTATQFDTVDSVRMLVDGEEVESIGGEGLMVDQPLGRADLEESGIVPAVLLEHPRPGDEIASPVRLTGSANVFEAVFQIEVVDGEGLIVAEERVMPSAGTGTRGTFEVSVDVEPWRPGLGAIVASIRSPRDGAREVVAEVPVRVG